MDCDWIAKRVDYVRGDFSDDSYHAAAELAERRGGGGRTEVAKLLLVDEAAKYDERQE